MKFIGNVLLALCTFILISCNTYNDLEDVIESNESQVDLRSELVNKNDTIFEVKFPTGKGVEEFIKVNVGFSRMNGNLIAYENDTIDISYIEYQGNKNTLAIGLKKEFLTSTSRTFYAEKKWIWVDVIYDDGRMETCRYYCDIIDGVAQNCCYEQLGNCIGLGPHCGPPIA